MRTFFAVLISLVLLGCAGPKAAIPPPKSPDVDPSLSVLDRIIARYDEEGNAFSEPDRPPAIEHTYDKEIIRRIIKRHLGDVKTCYALAALKDANLHGRVVVTFTIGEQGRVISSGIAQSTTGSDAVDTCIAQAVRHWSFPQPEKGIVIVSYPFELAMADSLDTTIRVHPKTR